MKITDLDAGTRFDNGDVLIKDGVNGTKQITAADAAAEFAGLVSSVNHRNVYRGKNLGTSITATQIAEIQAGTFGDLFIGDYWTINGVRYDIADMDYWYQIGDTAFTKHHLVMVPNNTMYTAKMNDTNITTGGYINSRMCNAIEADGETQDAYIQRAINTITTAFGNRLLTHRSYFTNATSGSAASGGAWVDSTVDLMSEIMVYGTSVRGNEKNVATSDKTQLALFRLKPVEIHRQRTAYWLRDVVSATSFAIVSNNGTAASYAASISLGVRPVFAVG